MEQEGHKIKINLSPRGREAISNVFLKWAINIGKTVIILTELVALGSLFYRFTIDRQIVDLHDQIKREETLVKVQEKKETEYRSIQERLSSIKVLTETTNSKITTLDKILAEIKKEGFLTTKLSLNQNTLIFEGEAPSVFNLAQFVNTLKSEEKITSINLNEVNNSETGVTFEIDLTLVSDTQTQQLDKNDQEQKGRVDEGKNL